MTEKQTKSGIKELSKNEVNNLVEKHWQMKVCRRLSTTH